MTLKVMLTDGIHDLDGMRGSAGLADPGFVLSLDPKDVLFVLDDIIDNGAELVGLGHLDGRPLHRSPVTQFDDVRGDGRTSVRLGGFPGDGAAELGDVSNDHVQGSIRNI